MCFCTMGTFSIDGCWLLYNPWEEAIFYRSENGSVWVPVELFRCRVIGCYGNCKLLHASGKSSFFSNLAIRIISAVRRSSAQVPTRHKCACKLRVFQIERMWLFSQVFAHQVHTQPYMKYIILTLLCISRFLFIPFLFFLFISLSMLTFLSFFLYLTFSLLPALFLTSGFFLEKW